jgi:hypothetical protein
MIRQFLDLLPEYQKFIKDHFQIRCLLPSTDEILALTQLAYVLKPFKDMTLKVSQSMPSLPRSLEIYWDLDDLLTKVITGEDHFSQLDESIRIAFAAGKRKHVVYTDRIEQAIMIFAAHILDPTCKASLIKEMMPEKWTQINTSLARYFEEEWPQTVFVTSLDSTPPLSPTALNTRPTDMSIARWKVLQNKLSQDASLAPSTLTSELERWLASEPVNDLDSNDRHTVRKWWKQHAHEWPALATAARDVLAVSASEVDVERLFSGCKDEIGIRRHSLKSDTIRVLTLLRSIYNTQDDVDHELIKAAMELDIIPYDRHSVLWRPDRIDGRIANGEA